jgi:MFS family permease
MKERRDLRWNFSAAVIDAAGWGLGMAFISERTVLPLFVAQLTSSPAAVGLIQTITLLGWLLPGILISGWLERQPRVKHSVMWLALGERVFLALLIPLCLWLGPWNRPGLLLAFFVCWLGMNALMGANMPGYYKLIVKTIPPEARGRMYGIGGALAGLMGVAAAPLCGWLLSTQGFPGGFAACFAAATVAMTVTVLPLGFMREAAQPPEATPERASVRQTLSLLRHDPRLPWLAAAMALFSLTQTAGGFYTTYAIQRFGAGPEAVAGFTAAQMVARTVGFLLAGWVGDHRGNRAALRLATACGVAAAVLALVAPGLGWMYAVFVLTEVAIVGWSVCSINYVLELCPTERSGSYTAVFNLVSGPLRALLPLLGGLLAAALGYGPLFWAAILGGMLSLALLAGRITEPRHDAREVIPAL